MVTMTLSPILWNGVGFLHYLVEHTHTFCADDSHGDHAPSEDCHSIYHIGVNHDHQQVPTEIEFHELKQLIAFETAIFIKSIASTSTSPSIYSSPHLGRSHAIDVFQPPTV